MENTDRVVQNLSQEIDQKLIPQEHENTDETNNFISNQPDKTTLEIELTQMDEPSSSLQQKLTREQCRLAQERCQRFCSQIKSFYTDHSQIIKNIFVFLINLLGTIFIIHSIQDCPQDDCSQFVQEFINNNMKIYIGICFIYSLSMFLSLHKKIDRRLGLAILILVIYISAFYDRVVTSNHYGGVVTILIGTSTLIWLVLLLLLNFFKQVYDQNLKVFLILILFVSFYSFYQFYHSCDTWAIGLQNQTIDQSHEYCHLHQPKVCPVAMFDSFIDLSQWVDCQNTLGLQKSYLNVMPKVNSTNRYVAFPHSKDLLAEQRYHWLGGVLLMQKNIFKNSYPVNSVEEGFQKKSQFVLDLDQSKYHIQVTRNETLVNLRMEGQKRKNSLSQNVLAIFLDAISRPHFHRAMPQTAQWLQNRAQLQQGKNIEYFRFYSNTPYTYPNFQAFKYQNYSLNNLERKAQKFPCAGQKIQTFFELSSPPYSETNQNFIQLNKYDPQCVKKHIDFNNADLYYQSDKRTNNFQMQHRNIFKSFRQEGFVIGRTAGMCVANSANVFTNDNILYYDETADHQGLVTTCDPNHEDPASPFQLFKGPYSLLKRCVNGNTVSQHSLEYGQSFWQAYSEDQQFLLLEFLDGHQPTGTVIKYLDDPLVKFLEGLDEKGLLDDTLVFLWSDHGNHKHVFSMISTTKQEKTERMYPFLILNLPQTFTETRGDLVQQLEQNQQKLFNSKTLHFFLQTWVQGTNYTHYDQSLFEKIDSKLKCNNVIDEVIKNQQYCVCD